MKAKFSSHTQRESGVWRRSSICRLCRKLRFHTTGPSRQSFKTRLSLGSEGLSERLRGAMQRQVKFRL